MTTVSVVIPTYNRADVLPRAVGSVLDQTVADLELLVVDDGSTDGTVALLEAYDDERLRVVEHETNQGANAARNTGIQEAEGEYVAFLDSDDEWRPRKLERQLDRVRDGEYVAAYCDADRSHSGVGGRVIGAVASLLARADGDVLMEGGKELAGEILADNLHSGAGSTLLVETGVARRIGGFDEELDRFQDPEFLLRVIQEGELAYVDEPLVVRYETATPDAETIRRADEEYLAKHDELVREAESQGYRVRQAHELLLGMRFLEEGKFAPAVAHLLRADVPARHWPGLAWAGVSGFRHRASTPATVVVGLVAVAVLYGVVTAVRSLE
ncbi:Glycosyl transferase family 2 [Halomicrobium zhouii]|uniref:Glycosyl transferase family 2 n=1 Tax=Halomicrobium zhouii TaxID=767519 RepID=A0A1I6KDA2_9EURY|nr:glycosyltransferase family 2 protein [Halomicrobium zhouii]SFR88850.1 Glycosyl transferase family 2 [Halomicrobium zhouii]